MSVPAKITLAFSRSPISIILYNKRRVGGSLVENAELVAKRNKKLNKIKKYKPNLVLIL